MKTGKLKRRLVRCASLVFAVMLCIQSLGTFANASSTVPNGDDIFTEEDLSFIKAIEDGDSAGKMNYWEKWEKAISLQGEGNYQEAIAALRQVAPYFKKSEGSANMALLFMRLGQCYIALTDYYKGAVCYRRSSQYWSITEGESETARYYSNMADRLKEDVRLYLKTSDERFNKTKFFGAPHENPYGILLGTTYNDDTSALTGIKHTVELQYLNYGVEFKDHMYLFNYAKENNTLLQIAFQPRGGLQSVERNDYLIEQAKFLESTGCRILLRFANEMNDQTSAWYTPNYNEYIEKFRMVANVFRTYAPSVGLVWAPNFYPADTMDLYYPGDEYVDYVGLSVYKGHSPEVDPLGKGVDRGRWSNILDTIYDTYGDRKPIIVSESGCSYFDEKTQTDITDFAVKQFKDYYTYLPIKYPNLKMAVLFNKESDSGKQYLLSRNPAILEAYKQGITGSPRFISDQSTQPTEYYSELENGYTVPASKVELCSYISEPMNKIDYVIYRVNGVSSTSYGIPYAVPVDFSAYAGQTITADVRAFRDDKVVAQESFSLQVLSDPPASTSSTQPAGTFSDVPNTAWYYTAVTDLASAGVVGGYPDGSFRPDGTVTYGEALKMIMLAAGYPEPAKTGSSWASGYITKALADGLLSGDVDPNKRIDRYTIAEIAAKALKLPESQLTASPFTDMELSHASSNYVLRLYEQRIVGGTEKPAGSGTFYYYGSNDIRRSEMVAIIWRINNYTRTGSVSG